GARGKNRERVYVDRGEPGDPDADGHQRGQDEQRLVGERGLERLRGALEAGADAGGQADLALGGLDGRQRVPQGDARREVEGEGDGGELPLVIDRERRGRRREVGEGAERHLRPARRVDVDVLQRVRALLEGRLHLQDDVVLVQLREDRRHLPLAEGVVERV